MKFEEIKKDMKVKVKENIASSFAGEIGEVTYIDIEDPENEYPIEVFFVEKEDIYYDPRDTFKPEDLEEVFEG